MKLNKLTFRNLASYGEIDQVIEFPQEPSFFLVQGDNGAGKCLHGDTELLITITDKELKKKFKEFSDTIEYIDKIFNGNGKEKEKPDGSRFLD